MLRVVTSEHDAWVGIAEQEALEGIPREGTPQWMEDPLAHPDGLRWAYVLSDKAEVLPADVIELPADWFPPREV